jgi:glycosyltransferase involved in cell wall biosynthesis
MTRFSVIIPVFNGAESIGRTLGALGQQRLPEGVELEIVVADDGSSDGSSDSVRQNYPLVTVVRQENSGPAAARNLGAAVATGDYLLFVDSDDMPSKEWIATFADLVTTPDVGVAGCGARFIDGITRETVEVVPSSKPNQVVLLVSGLTAVRRDVFEQIDGYDAALRFGENSDMISRALRQCRSSGAHVVARDVIAIDLVFGNASASYDEKRLDAVLHLLERDRESVERDSKLRSRYYSIAAVNAGRCEKWPSARRYALSAVRAQPTEVRHAVRLAMSLCPPIARHRWSSNRTRIGPS